MNKSFIFLLLIAVSLCVSFGAGSNAESAPIYLVAMPTPTPLAEIERLELDKNEVLIPCPPIDNIPKEGRACPDDDGLVAVKTIVRNPKKAPLVYAYTVSGGRIVGQGEKVVWDLKGVRPGTYTITAAIDDGRGFSYETKNQTIPVRECDCPLICICPTLSVSGGGVIKAGETVEFTANVSGGTAADITYNWTISQGEIIEGQGTSKITVKTTKETTGTITATVEIGGDLCAVCLRTASESATIIK